MYKFYHLLTALFISIASISCTTTALLKKAKDYEPAGHRKNVYKYHVLEVDNNGLHESRVLPDEQDTLTLKKHIAAIISGIDKHLDTSPKILIHFHGGLNSQGAAFKRAVKIKDSMLADGVYPIFINWHSGATSYFNHLFYASAGMNYRQTRKIAAIPLLISDLFSGIARTPSVMFNSLYNEIEDEGNYDVHTNDFGITAKNTNSIYNALRTKMQADPARELTIYRDKDLREPSIFNIRRDVSQTTFPSRYLGLVLYDGAGKPAWKNMNRRVQGLIHPGHEFDIRDYRSDTQYVAQHLARHADGVLAKFIDSLSSYLKTKEKSAYEITIVGHSMGAIVANNMIRHYPDFPAKYLVHMAAAAPIYEWETSVFPYLARDTQRAFYNLMLHPVAENREHNAMEVLMPRGSLLVHVDNIFEEPESFMGRTSGRWDNVLQSVHIIPDSLKKQITLKGFPVKKKMKAFDKEQEKKMKGRTLTNDENIENFTPQKHGQFDDGAFWRKEFWEVKK